MSPVLNLLTIARGLIEDPCHWTQGYYAKAADGSFTDSYSSKACSFCTVGALGVAKFSSNSSSVDRNIAIKMLSEYAISKGFENCVFLNDNSTHEEVLKMFDSAIEKAKNEQQPQHN